MLLILFNQPASGGAPTRTIRVDSQTGRVWLVMGQFSVVPL